MVARSEGKCNRLNWRNEAVKMRSLLLSACRELERYGVQMPDRVQEWWTAQKSLARARKVQQSEFGVLQTLIAEEEARAERHNDTGEC